jgi:hypothetical protein
MKKILLSLVILFASACLFAQTAKNPFEEYGYKKQVMFTSSKGEFEEFHDQTDIVEIGSVLFDTKRNKVIGFVDDEAADTEIASSTAAMSVDPLCEKYYWISPYAYCAGNPIKFVDPNGMMYTDYINDRGELLYRTDDGLTDIIIVPNDNIPKLETKLNEAYAEGKIDDPITNEEEMHTLGTNIDNIRNSLVTGTPSLDAGITRGYDEAYNDIKPSFAEKLQRVIFGIEEENAKINAGHVNGKSQGKYDREHGKINKLNPYSSLKGNKPLLTVPKQKYIDRKYPGVGLPSK